MKLSGIATVLAAALLTTAVHAQEPSEELGRNPFERMTPEERREAFGNMSEEDRAKLRKQRQGNRDGARRRTESMTPEQRENRRKQFESMSPEQRQQMRERRQSRGGNGERRKGSRKRQDD